MSVAEFAAAKQEADAAAEKARLIAEALCMMSTAEKIDERDSFDLTGWADWYDATLPKVRDIEILAGAMRIELHRRRGEQILAEEERRGGLPTKVTQRVTLPDASKMQRSRDRALASQREHVAAFVQQELAAGRAPSLRGAVRAVKATLPKTVHKTTAALTRSSRNHQRLVDRIAKVSGTPQTVGDLGTCFGLKDAETRRFLHDAALLPWVRLDRSGDAYTILVDDDLRNICEGRVPRPALGNQSIRAYLQSLRTEITRRRKENHDDFRQRKWNSELILKREQTALLDWIEEQLMKVPN